MGTYLRSFILTDRTVQEEEIDFSLFSGNLPETEKVKEHREKSFFYLIEGVEGLKYERVARNGEFLIAFLDLL